MIRIQLAAPVLLLSFAAACGGDKPKPAATPTVTSVSKTAPNVGDSGHDLAMLATACWFGGTWGDKPSTEQNCMEVVRRVYGSDDKGHYEQLRGYEEAVVTDVAAKVSQKAAADEKEAPAKDALVSIVKAFAGAQRELMFARRAADRIKRDLKEPETEAEKEKLSADEAKAVMPLKTTTALDALLKLDAGPLKADAHALGVMTAIERISVIVGLPKHMKVFAASGAVNLLFGVPAPTVSEEADKPLPHGAWLAYLTDVAKAANHPVPDTAKAVTDREPMAWSGLLQGLADKLRADEPQLSEKGRLLPIVSHAAMKLENEAKSNHARHATATPTATATATPTPTPTATPTATPTKGAKPPKK